MPATPIRPAPTRLATSGPAPPSQRALDLRAQGLTLRAIGAELGGLSRERTRQALIIARRRYGLEPTPPS